MKNKILGVLTAVFAAWSSSACVSPPSLACGDGTSREGQRCVGTLKCSSGTHEEGGVCVADPVELITCGAGTHVEGTACVIDLPPDPPPSPWSQPVQVCTPGVSCTDPVLLQTPAGAVLAVSESGDASLSVVVYVQDTSGFTLAKRFEGASSVAMTPTLAMRGSTLYLAYTDYEPSQTQRYGNGDLMLSVSADFGKTWTAPRRINEQPATTLLYSPRLTVSSAGIDLLYVDTDGQTTADNMYRHSDDDGVTFSAPVKLPSGGQYDSLSPSAPAVRVGDELEVPVLRSGYDLSTGDALSSVEVLSLTPMPQMQTQTTRVKRVFNSRDFPLDPVPVLDANQDGVRCLAFIDAPSRDYSVYAVRSQGPLDGSQRPVLLPGGPGSVQTAPAIAVTPSGDCQLAWLDNRSGAWELYEATLRADGAWTSPQKVSPMSFTEDGVAHSLSARVQVKFDGAGRHLAWTDLRGGVESVSYSSAP
ncbi:MAG: sialidase family protein [Myxococcaceae bacterium]